MKRLDGLDRLYIYEIEVPTFSLKSHDMFNKCFELVVAELCRGKAPRRNQSSITVYPSNSRSPSLGSPINSPVALARRVTKWQPDQRYCFLLRSRQLHSHNEGKKRFGPRAHRHPIINTPLPLA